VHQALSSNRSNRSAPAGAQPHPLDDANTPTSKGRAVPCPVRKFTPGNHDVGLRGGEAEQAAPLPPIRIGGLGPLKR